MPEPNEGHTVKRYDAELGQLRSLVLEMGGLVIDQIHVAVKSLQNEDLELARKVVDRDHVVNGLDVKANEQIVNLIALRQPVANDLRLVIAIAKAVSDLERIGDEAVKVARMALRIYDSDTQSPNKKLMRDIRVMAEIARTMLRRSLDAFDRMDLESAVGLAQEDEELDNEFQSAMRRLATFVMEDSRNVGHALNVVFIIKALERIGDHAKNISEYVVFQVKGKDVRHVSASRLADGIRINGVRLD